MKKLVLSSLVAALGFTAQANAATPEVSASVSVANTYLFRGLDLGNGSAQVAGDLIADFGGLYGGAWLSSGDDALGTEADFFAGYAFDIADTGISADLGYLTYVYPTSDIGAGEVAEVYAVLGYAYDDVELAYSFNFDVSQDSTLTTGESGRDWTYMSLSAAVDQFGVLVGYHNDDSAGNGLLHIDGTYAYNDNLAFTVSVPVDGQDFAVFDDNGVQTGTRNYRDNDPTYVATLSLPIEF